MIGLNNLKLLGDLLAHRRELQEKCDTAYLKYLTMFAEGDDRNERDDVWSVYDSLDNDVRLLDSTIETLADEEKDEDDE